jgi:hypothetical protein
VGDVETKRALRHAAAEGRLGHLLREVLGEWGAMQALRQATSEWGMVPGWVICELEGGHGSWSMRHPFVSKGGKEWVAHNEFACSRCRTQWTPVQRRQSPMLPFVSDQQGLFVSPETLADVSTIPDP